MQDVSEYSDNTSNYELFTFFCEQIIGGKISTFSSLKRMAAPVIVNKKSHSVIMQAFELLKKTNWGFFSGISPRSHAKLWKELVIPDKNFPDAGDLKRTLQISNIYIAMLDIHGYTKFCMDSRKNLSMMHILDRAIEFEISKICTACGAVSQRERGDEVVVVAASATDIITASLGIIDYFSKTNVVRDPLVSTERSADASALPVFKISAGITGGNTTSPLIITEKSTLSGFLLNSAARLQMRANELSPQESRIMVARQVQMQFLKENAQSQCSLVKNNAVYFFYTGHIEFKGVMIPACEMIFNEEERYKEEYSDDMISLFEAIRENAWEQRIFTDLIKLITRTVMAMPHFLVTPAEPLEGITVITNKSIVDLGKRAKLAYAANDDYDYAVTLLHKIIEIITMIPSFDRLILDYLQIISARYTGLLNAYNENVDRQIESNAVMVFQENYNAWETAKKGVQMFEKLRETARKSESITRKKTLWYNLIKQKRNELAFTLYAGKE
ncbi:MAG: hypothetical protein FWG89_04355 [Treponema sp.]|nr:hypothetical protein [Treponema sp.]